MKEKEEIEELVKKLEEESKRKNLTISHNDLILIVADYLKEYGEGLD